MLKNQDETIGLMSTPSDNRIAYVLRAIGGLIVVLSIFVGFSYESFIIGFSGSMSGLLLIGFSEIIKILHEMNERQKTNHKEKENAMG